MADVSGPLVVVVAYHAVPALRRALAALEGAEVLVVDNSASVAVRAAAAEAGAEYLDTGGNVGFARAVNRGIEHSGGRDVVLVNPDAMVSSATVAALVDRLQPGPRTAATAPASVGTDGVEQRVRWPFPTPAGAWLQAAGLGRLRRKQGGFLVGAVLALNAAALADIGGFDASFFLYGEETDWERRAVAAEWHLVLADDLQVTHIGGGTSAHEERREVHFHAGGERYIRKWHGRVGWASYRAAVIAGAVLRVAALPGDRRRAAGRRLLLHWRGPLRCEQQLEPA